MCNPKEVAAAKVAARAAVARAGLPAADEFQSAAARKLQRLRLYFEVTVDKFEEFSASLDEMSVNSFVTQCSRHNYAAENAMKHFRDALLKSPTKRIEIVECYTWLKLDRFVKAKEGKLRTGWGCPGISELPPAVTERDLPHISVRARNIRKRHWKRRAQKRAARHRHAV